MVGLMNVPKWAAADVRRADKLARQARAAALAGNQAKAQELRRQYDALYDAIEAQAAARASVPAGADSQENAPALDTR